MLFKTIQFKFIRTYKMPTLVLKKQQLKF